MNPLLGTDLIRNVTALLTTANNVAVPGNCNVILFTFYKIHFKTLNKDDIDPAVCATRRDKLLNPQLFKV